MIWLGPLIGALLPCAVWWISNARKFEWKEPLRFFAGFCLIANGAYLGSVISSPVGDASDLLNHGAHRWQLLLFAVITIPLGILAWDDLTPHLRRISDPKLGTIWGILGVALIVLFTIYWRS